MHPYAGEEASVKRVAIIQARMTSTRLPGKVLLDLAGQPMLAQQLRRVKRCRHLDEIVLATTTNDADTPIIELARREGVAWFRGSEHDVLARYTWAARESGAGAILRITADCPLVDPDVIDLVMAELESHAQECDYASNVLERSYPRGLDAEVFFRDTLERVNRMAHSQTAREHVTWFLYRERLDLFVRRSVVDTQDNSDLRWTVDTPEDFEVVRRIYEGLGAGERFVPYREVLAYAREHPEIGALNADVEQRNTR